MKIISHYEPPAPGALDALKNELGRIGRGMAELAALAGDSGRCAISFLNGRYA